MHGAVTMTGWFHYKRLDTEGPRDNLNCHPEFSTDPVTYQPHSFMLKDP